MVQALYVLRALVFPMCHVYSIIELKLSGGILNDGLQK
ncbi:MAG: hypothetical protein QG555_1012 [Thermodesulfobacteriota bacterium]|nr:hypothetical protein [Thermodesulfobacteriota bacterium]